MEKLDNHETNCTSNKNGNGDKNDPSIKKVDHKSKGDFCIDDITFDSYTTSPEDLIILAYKLSNIGKFDDAIEVMAKAIEMKLALINNDRNFFDMARFYVVNADLIVIKINETANLFGGENNNNTKDKQLEEKILQEKNQQNCRRNDATKAAVKNEKGEDNEDNDYEDDEDQVEEEEEEATDEEIAYDNLFAAQKIYQQFLKPYNIHLAEDLDDNVRKVYLKLAGVFSLFGELEMSKSDFKKAINFFEEALLLYRKYDNLFSRDKGEVYYKMAMSYDFDPYKNFVCFYYTKSIIENHLQKELDKDPNNSIIVFNPQDEALVAEGKMDLIFDLDKVKLPKNLEESENDSQKIRELKSILKELYIKVIHF